MTSPAEELRAFTVEWNDQAVLDWVEAHGDAVLALFDAAQTITEQMPGQGPRSRALINALDDAAAALARLNNPQEKEASE